MTVTCSPRPPVELEEVVSRETESVATTLLQGIAQPVLQLLSVSQLRRKKRDQPTVLFFANREMIRPFLYYKEQNILLTTETPFQWMKSGILNLEAVSAVAMLLEGGASFDEDVGEALQECCPPTGFIKAMSKASSELNTTFCGSKLKPTMIPLPPPTTQDTAQDDKFEPAFVDNLEAGWLEFKKNKRQRIYRMNRCFPMFLICSNRIE